MAFSKWGVTKNDAEYLLGSILHSHILQSVAYGMYTATYFVAVYLILSRGTVKVNVRSGIITITLMWLFCTVYITARWMIIDDAYIRHADNRETQLIATMPRNTVPLDLTKFVVSFLGVLLADATMIWRCWTLYGRRWIITVVPVLALSIGTAAYILQGFLHFTSKSDGLKTPVAIHIWKIVFLVSTVLTNVFCTIAIICRLLVTSEDANPFRKYRRLLEILIESAILYTLIYLIHLGMYVHNTYFTERWNTDYYYPEALTNVVTGAAPTLIIARVAAGHARPDSWRCLSLPQVKPKNVPDSNHSSVSARLQRSILKGITALRRNLRPASNQSVALST